MMACPRLSLFSPCKQSHVLIKTGRPGKTRIVSCFFYGYFYRSRTFGNKRQGKITEIIHFRRAHVLSPTYGASGASSCLVSAAGAGLPVVDAEEAFLKDCSKSAMMSSMCSVPTEMRMRSSLTPELVFSSSESCSWVVVQGLFGHGQQVELVVRRKREGEQVLSLVCCSLSLHGEGV